MNQLVALGVRFESVFRVHGCSAGNNSVFFRNNDDAAMMPLKSVHVLGCNEGKAQWFEYV